MSDVYKGKTFLLPGASSGIGLCAANKLASLGANIVLLSRNAEKLDKALQSLPPGNHAAITFDVADIKNIEGIVQKIVGQYEKIDGMLYCVGNGDIARLKDLVYDRLYAVMAANYFAFMEFCRALSVNKKKKSRLAIVAISSLASTSPEKYFTAYSASKAALEASIRCLALELASRNTTIKAIKPGVVRTGRLEYFNEMTGDVDAKIKESGFQPMGVIPPEDVADLAIYLLGENADYINGASLSINGGAH